jgi:hypothetical protein
MKIIKLILGVQACILGCLLIAWMLMYLAFMGIELDMVAYEYEMMEEINESHREKESY